jgi:tryptophanyl-tRNA synthetase
VYAIHRLLKSAEELEQIYEEHKGKYGDLKKLLIADLEAFITPMREKRATITDEQIKTVLQAGVARAKQVSNETLTKVRTAIGIGL